MRFARLFQSRLSAPVRRSAGFLLCLLLAAGPSLGLAEGPKPVEDRSGHLDVRFEATTFVLDLEKQGLQDNTFLDGVGRDTTLIGDLVSSTLHYQFTPTLRSTLGVFANIPFGFDTEVSRVEPIARLEYQPDPGATALVGTLHVPHRLFFDAVFDNANRFVRPIEQGGQLTAEYAYYRQDAFINWEQSFRGSTPKRFDVGYAGQVLLGPLRLNGQVHWVQKGQALLKLDRSFNTRKNVVSAFGPELAVAPTRYLRVPSWFREIGVRATYLNSFHEPNSLRPGPTVRGRGYELMVWLDLDGWQPRVGFWRGNNFITQQGDPEFKDGSFTEVGLSKIFVLNEAASIELGAQARKLHNFVNQEGFKWVNQEYFVLNWNFDSGRHPLISGFLDAPLDGSEAGASGGSTTLLQVKADTLTYVYNVQFEKVSRVNGRPVTNPTFIGEYLAPVMQYRPTPRLSLSAGVFAGLPIGSEQHFHTVQPIVSGELELWERVTLVAGTLHRNHPLLDAVFDDTMLFTRPVEQGFQLLVNRPTYQQDFFINWNQVETSLKPERFDIGYAGRYRRGLFGLNGQVYWTHEGGAQFSESRSLLPGGLRNRTTRDNVLFSVGPDFSLPVAQYHSGLSWFREIHVAAYYLTDRDQPIDRNEPVTRGRGYYLEGGVDLDGWRPYVKFWRGEQFVTANGDPTYFAGNFTEYGLLKDFVLPKGFTLRVGGLARQIGEHIMHTEYALLNWSWDQAPWRGFCQRPTLLHPSEKSCGLF